MQRQSSLQPDTTLIEDQVGISDKLVSEGEGELHNTDTKGQFNLRHKSAGLLMTAISGWSGMYNSSMGWLTSNFGERLASGSL